MPMLLKRGSPSEPLRQIVEMNEKRRKLEDDIRTLDSLNKSLMETEAQKDIEDYKNRRPRPNLAVSS